MARILVEDYVNVEPEEYLKECSRREKSELFDLLSDEGFTQDLEQVSESGSISEREFNRNLYFLKDAWLAITPDDLKIIDALAKKYGGY